MKKKLMNCIHDCGRSKLFRVMKLTIFFLLAGFLAISAESYSQSQHLNLKMKDAQIVDVLNAIEEQSEFYFFYKNDEITGLKTVDVQFEDATIDKILLQILNNTGLSYRIVDKYIVISPDKKADFNRQVGTRKIEGKVRDSLGASLPGVTIAVKGTVQGTITDGAGNFSLTNVAEDATLIFSFVGMKNVEVGVAGQTSFDVTLEEETIGISEVVAIGYGVQKKVNLTGSVSNIDFDAVPLASRPLTNISSALSGLSPGLFVAQKTGTPGSDGATIKVRGTGSLNSSQDPLVIIDGQPGDLNSVSPNDVASVSVLKDAASSAIYGSRASNGVILITTKSGADMGGKVTFSYDGNVGFSKPTKLYDIISNTADHMSVINQIQKNSGRLPSFTDEKIDAWRENSKTDPLLYPNTDWWDVLITENVIQNHSFSARGGSNKIQFYNSFNYLNNGGLMENTGYEQFTFRNNLTYKITDWLKLGNSVSALYGKTDPGSTDAVFQWFIATTPGLTPKHPDGRYGGGMTGIESGANNPLRTLETARGEKNTKRYTGKLFAVITPIKGLEVNGSYFIDSYIYDAWSSSVPSALWDFQTETVIQSAATTIGISNSYSKSTRKVIDLFATYSKSFDNHNFKFLGGFNQEYYKSSSFSSSKRDLYSLDIPVLDAAATNVSSGGTASDFAMLSYFGRLNYDFSQKYLFEANIRADGSSRFSPGNRWGFFPSFSAGWRISEENFWGPLKNSIDNFKFRASWGQLGNNGIGNYDWQSTYTAANHSFNGTVVQGVSPSSIANEEISWEVTDVFNIGADFNLFEKLDVVFDYYNKYTHGILASTPIPYVNGGLTAPKTNSAAVRNTGFEAELNYMTSIGDLQISAGLNGSFNKNKIEKYKGDLLESHDQGVWTEGQPIGKFYVREIDHIVQDKSEIDQLLADGWTFNPSTPGPGDFLYKDANPDKKINDDDRVLKGNPIPVFTYGLDLALAYRGFDFYMLMNGVSGWDKYTSTQFFSLNAYVQGYLYPTYFMDQWTENNPGTTIPKVYTSNAKNQQTSDYHLHSSSYLRIKTLQLGYTVPSRITNKFEVEKLRAFVNLENFFTFTSFPGMDPETSGSAYNADTTYPLLKTISFGLNLNF